MGDKWRMGLRKKALKSFSPCHSDRSSPSFASGSMKLFVCWGLWINLHVVITTAPCLRGAMV
jgi:hypothetical protein